MYKRVLLPIDLHEETSWKETMPLAASLTSKDSGELHVVTVLPDLGMSIVGTYMQEGAEQKAMDEAKRRLKDFLESHAPDVATLKGHVLKGTIYLEIMRAADELECDLIVLASHRPDLKDYLLGPNAARVVRHAKQSVHIIRV